MSAAPIYRTAIAPEWIDFNGHLRDAYYTLIISYAADALMDHLGMNQSYRQRTRCTLYTLELHIHYLREVKQSDFLEAGVRILASDPKRIHAAFDLSCQRYPDPVATAELLLLHVRQDEKPTAQPFPADIAAALAALERKTSGPTIPGFGSRRIELRRRP